MQQKGVTNMVYKIEELRTMIVSLLQKYGADHAILFGSYARQEADAASDIDLVVFGGAHFDPTDVFCIADDLYRLTGKKVDVYEMREINEGSDFHRTILSEGVRIA